MSFVVCHIRSYDSSIEKERKKEKNDIVILTLKPLQLFEEKMFYNFYNRLQTLFFFDWLFWGPFALSFQSIQSLSEAF